jgi:Ni,Fe-hydrogenase III small subunit/formate hydrogenlyase subunit 6/NADH:ubiquinone oxidoreductase subunit I
MLEMLLARLRQGTRTHPFPTELPTLPDRFRGRPQLDATKCREGCRDCVDACPTQAITASGGEARLALSLDLGRCLFCTDCVEACPEGAIVQTTEFALATRTREALVLTDVAGGGAEGAASRARGLELAGALDAKTRRLFGRSLKLRVVSAAGCNGCEADVNVLGTLVFDLGRFGIDFVASPRHADGLLLTGPISRNMELAVRKTWDAMPSPKLVIAVGACAISGGPFVDHPEVRNGASALLPVDLFVPGCPPHPFTILDGLLRLLGRLERGA